MMTWLRSLQTGPIYRRYAKRMIDITLAASALIVLAPLLLLAPVEEIRSPLWLVTGFVLFRVFDIWKPGPARWAERNFQGGAGVVLDDVVAGCFGALVMSAALALGAG